MTKKYWIVYNTATKKVYGIFEKKTNAVAFLEHGGAPRRTAWRLGFYIRRATVTFDEPK